MLKSRKTVRVLVRSGSRLYEKLSFKRQYSVSCDLSAISAPIGTDRHRYRHLVPVPAPVPLPAPAPAPLPAPAPAPTGPDRHRPARAGTKRHRPAQTGTDRHRPAQDRHGPAPCRHDINFDYLVVNNDNYQF
jgi:hypothetical protein